MINNVAMNNRQYPKWRWDQGRLDYFRFGNIKKIASVLVRLDGIELSPAAGGDPLRDFLMSETELPYSAPENYKVWRNYKRVFESTFLATAIDGRLAVSDFCRRLATEDGIDADEYLSLLFPRFKLPFFGFQNYSVAQEVVFPFCVILKFLISRRKYGGAAAATLDTIFSLLVGNEMTGLEPLENYRNLEPVSVNATSDSMRQVREMLIFMSQISILKWSNGVLELDATLTELVEENEFSYLTTPVSTTPKATAEEEFFAVTSLDNSVIHTHTLQARETVLDDSFVEGKRTRVTHLKIERSPILRKMFLKRYNSAICNMCVADLQKRYPWTGNLLEVHHVLPLSSSLTVDADGTSLDDVVGLCPNCHRGVHSYYKHWLNSSGLTDFRSKDEAKKVYSEAKSTLVI